MSILFPQSYNGKYNQLSKTCIHDLGLDQLVKEISSKELDQTLILKVLSNITSDKDVARFRIDIFDDILANKSMRETMLKILDKINFLKDYGSFLRETPEGAAPIWDLLHRLGDLKDYILCVESLYECLKEADIHSKGLNDLKDQIYALYEDNGFKELKKDIESLKTTTDNLKSVTIGVNLNQRFEAESIGVVSINSKPFTKSNALGGFLDKLNRKDILNENCEWSKNFSYHPFTISGNGAHLIDSLSETAMMMAFPILATGITQVPDKDSTSDLPRYMNRVTNHMLSLSITTLKEVLSKYIGVTIIDITSLIPELLYYVKWAEYIEKKSAEGFIFSKPSVCVEDSLTTRAKGVYNLKLLDAVNEMSQIVTNDFIFDRDHYVYLLTGANRGGKTTITQAIGQLFVLAQGGIHIPGSGFSFQPVDNIFTHFPADEDQTLDLGRLGEECTRFSSIFCECTCESLLLLNETFSTTSFEEGYFIAYDSVRAIMSKGVRTVYNTHMHKLARKIEEFNSDDTKIKAASIIVESTDGNRSFKVKLSEPEGSSFAHDIAEKYGVTYEKLINCENS